MRQNGKLLCALQEFCAAVFDRKESLTEKIIIHRSKYISRKSV